MWVSEAKIARIVVEREGSSGGLNAVWTNGLVLSACNLNNLTNCLAFRKEKNSGYFWLGQQSATPHGMYGSMDFVQAMK